jgi:hypothetical protein
LGAAAAILYVFIWAAAFVPSRPRKALGLLLGAVLLHEPLVPLDAVALLVIGVGLWLVAREG